MRQPRWRASASARSSTAVLPTPAGPRARRAPPRPASASSSRRRSSVADGAPAEQPVRLCAGRDRAVPSAQPTPRSRARSRSASGLGAVPSSRRSACSSRSNWRSAAAQVALRRRWPGPGRGGPARRPGPRQQLVPAPGEPEQVDVQRRGLVAGLLGPRLVEVVGQQRAAVGVERLRGREPRRGRPARSGRPPELVGVDADVVGRADSSTMSLRSCRRAGRVAERAAGVVRRLVQPRPGRLDGTAGQSASTTCSRCSRRPGARASSLTSEAAWRRVQASAATGTPSTATSNPPSSRTLIVTAGRPFRPCPR